MSYPSNKSVIIESSLCLLYCDHFSDCSSTES